MQSEVAEDRVLINSTGLSRLVLPMVCIADPIDAGSVRWEEMSLLSYVMFITFLLIAFVVRW